MTKLPPLNSLRAFDVAGRFLNFRAAADDLGVTQGAVAQHVRQLEAQLGVQLFERLPKGLAFTAAGRSYHLSVAAAFEALGAATDQLTPTPDKVTVSVTPSFAAKWLIPNLPDLAAKHPDIDLRILATEKVSSFHSDGIDLAVRQGTPPFGAALQAHLLFRQEVIAVAAPRLIGGRDLPLSADDVAALPKLHDTHDLWPAFLAMCDIKAERSNGLRLSQTSLAMDAALFGQGAALVSRFLVAQDLEVGRLVEVGATWDADGKDFYVLVPRTAKNNEAVVKVMTWLTARSAEDT